MTSPKQHRIPKGERTRARILEAATELFSQSGFRVVSLRDIAAHAGLTHAGLLHHFTGKEDLLLQILSHRDAVDAKLLFAEHPDGGAAALLQVIVGFVERNTGTPAMVALYVKVAAEATDPEHPAHAYFTKRYQVIRARIAEILAALAAESGPRAANADTPAPLDADSAARQLIALMDGLQTQWLLEPDSVDMRAEVISFLDRLGLDATAALPPGPAEPASSTSTATTTATSTASSTEPEVT
ncbi:TetR/AcrR family transcriptional regulator [Spirillospora sp. NPDC049652]